MRNLVIIGVLVSFPLGFAHAQIPAAERAALIELYTVTDGPNWGTSVGWLGPVGTECSWSGVVCAGGFVDTLNLYDNNLNGPIPPELADLTEVRFLFLKGNNLNGTIPPILGTLSNLETLHLFDNDLSGEIPPELGDLSSLVRLWLPFNRLNGEIPHELGDLSNLEWLYLYDNELVGEIPVELGDLSSLTRMYLYNNQLVGDIPVELGDLSDLEILNLHSNQLSGIIPVEFGSLLSLQELYLAFNRLTGEIPPILSTLPDLLRLDLTGNLLTGEIPSQLGSTDRLRMLFLGSNDFDGEIPSELGNLQNLRLLDLSHNRLSGYIPPEIGDIRTMERLYLESNRLIGQMPQVVDLTSLANNDGMDLRWNALYNTDPDLDIFLFTKQIDDFWEPSQTTAPTGLRTLRTGDHTVELAWDPVTTLDTYEGGFEAFYVPTSGGSWTSAGRTSAKDVLAIPVTGLNPDVSYDFAMATYTKPHVDNSNEVLSELGDVVTESTTNTGCVAPIISMVWDPTGAVLTVDQTGTYEWSTGEATQSITVNPTDRQYYWVWVTVGACTEADIIFVEPELFKDGFESGDTTEWSLISP